MTLQTYPRYTCNMLFHQGIIVYQVIDPVGRQQVFKFHAPDPGRISNLDIEIIIYLVVIVDDLDPEWFGIAKHAIIDPFNMKMFFCLCVTAGLEQ